MDHKTYQIRWRKEPVATENRGKIKKVLLKEKHKSKKNILFIDKKNLFKNDKKPSINFIFFNSFYKSTFTIL
jgi:hypothetical protein